MGDAQAEAELVTVLAPFHRKLATASRISTAIVTARSAGWSHFTGSLNKTIRPSPAKLVQRALVLVDQRTETGVILAEHAHHLLGLRRFGERSEAAQVAEHDTDVAAMALDDIVRRM